ncbi:MAG TPA: FtsQ-type POTRA domain-containing protein [Acidimicrobiales bacterium]|nr:FtsQ-type POTRA domain-containing protein [Acidimicrobiales bacterium]
MPGRPPVMEPRIRVRRAQVRKQEGRKRLRVLVAVLVVAAVAGAAWGTVRSPLVDVDHIVVEGALETGPAPVATASRVHRRAAMVDIDEGAVGRRLRALPWVRSAVVQREWPGTVRIRIVERVPVAMTPNGGGGWALVDVEGRVLKWLATPEPGVLAIGGLPPAGAPGVMLAPEARGLLDVAEAVPSELRPRLTGAILDAAGITLGLAPAGTILLGGAEDLGAKLRAAQMVLAGVDTTGVGVIDVRFPATPTLTRVQP